MKPSEQPRPWPPEDNKCKHGCEPHECDLCEEIATLKESLAQAQRVVEAAPPDAVGGLKAEIMEFLTQEHYQKYDEMDLLNQADELLKKVLAAWNTRQSPGWQPKEPT